MPSFTSCSQAYASTKCAYLAAISWSSIALWSRPGCSRHITYVASPLLLGGDTPLEPHGFTSASSALLALLGIIDRRRALATCLQLAAPFSLHWSGTTCAGPTRLALAQQSPLVRHDLHWPNKVSFAPLNSIAIVTSLQMNCTHDW